MEKKLVLQLIWKGTIYNIYERITSDLYVYSVSHNVEPDVFYHLFDMRYFRCRYDKSTALTRVVDEIIRNL